MSLSAYQISIADLDGYYSATTVEDALIEIAQDNSQLIDTQRLDIGTPSTTDGMLNINQTSENSGITIESDGYYWRVFAKLSDSNNLHFEYNGSARGYLDSSTDQSTIDFTGQHRSLFDSNLNDSHIGYIVSSTGEYSVPLSGTGPTIQINESIPKVDLSSTPRDKRVFGVISGFEDNSSNRKYNNGSFVSVMPKNNSEKRVIINSLGEGGIWVSNINGNLENGDYICSSLIPGIGMRQDDDILRNYTVAKITTDCKFDSDDCLTINCNNENYKVAFVGCTYHCG